MSKKDIILVSKDTSLRTMCNKIINKQVKMIKSFDLANSYINQNLENIDALILDEKAIGIDPVLYINNIKCDIPSICIYSKEKNFNKNYGNLTCISRPISHFQINFALNAFKSNTVEAEVIPLVGASRAINTIRKEIELLKKTNEPIHIEGETGTGKTIVAHMIHNSRKLKNPTLQYINCSELDSTLMRTLLFGNTKGAFTDAHSDNIGIIEKSNNGTLFLDEIGNLPLSAQKELLNVLDNKKFRVVGGDIKYSNFSLITASNEKLEDLVDSGRMKLDFFHRINTFKIVIPPLRDRKEDIPILINYFRETIGEKRNYRTKDMCKLIHNPWKGNVRELIKNVKRSSILSQKDYLEIL